MSSALGLHRRTFAAEIKKPASLTRQSFEGASSSGQLCNCASILTHHYGLRKYRLFKKCPLANCNITVAYKTILTTEHGPLTVPMLQQYIPCTTTANTRINLLGNDNIEVSCGRDRKHGHTFRDSRSGPVRIDRTLNM